jgi:uncharacterized membrane protein
MSDQPTMAELAEETLNAASTYIRQRGRALVEDIAVEPVRRGAALALTIAFACGLLLTGAVLLGIGAVMGLSEWLGSAVAGFFAAGALVVLVGVGLVLLGMKRSRKERGEATDVKK